MYTVRVWSSISCSHGVCRGGESDVFVVPMSCHVGRSLLLVAVSCARCRLLRPSTSSVDIHGARVVVARLQSWRVAWGCVACVRRTDVTRYIGRLLLLVAVSYVHCMLLHPSTSSVDVHGARIVVD